MARFEAKNGSKGSSTGLYPLLPRFFRDCGWLIGFATLHEIHRNIIITLVISPLPILAGQLSVKIRSVGFHSKIAGISGFPQTMTLSIVLHPQNLPWNGEKSLFHLGTGNQVLSGATLFMGYGAISLGCHIWACPQKGICVPLSIHWFIITLPVWMAIYWW